MPHDLLILAWSLPNLGGTLLTAFGIGLVIFVHEFGHFLCARATGVDVEVFSLGFGPRLVGFVAKGTDYRISAVPLGGYVKLRGDQPGEEVDHPGSYHTKTIGQKLLVRSGGVIANLLFAVVAFPITFGVGIEMDAPTLGRVAPGGPAWRAGLMPGDEVLEVNGRPIHSFTDVFLEVALGDPDGVPMRVRRGSGEHSLVARPEYSDTLGTYAIKIEQAVSPRLRVRDDGAAARAGVAGGDELVAIDGCRRREYFADFFTGARDRPLTLTLRSADGKTRDVSVRPNLIDEDAPRIVGVAPVTLAVGAIRGSYAVLDAPLRIGDRVVSIDDQPVYSEIELVRALSARQQGEATEVRLGVERSGATIETAIATTSIDVLLDSVAFAPADALPSRPGVPITVSPDSPASRAGLKDGDRLLRVGAESVASWQDAFRLIRLAEDEAVTIVAATADGERTLPLQRASLAYPDFGIAFETASVVRRYPWGEACSHGLYASWNMTRQVYVTLKKMVSRQVSTENLGSIVSISVMSYHVAMEGLVKLLYFLALLSINLAVMNVLPIPILDGGYIMFLLIEKVTGAPISERVMGYSQLVGLAFIFALLIYVIKNDIERLLF